MNPAKGTNNLPWTALVMRLTRESVAVDTDGDVKPFPAGTEILIGGVDNESLYLTANDPREVSEVVLTPRDSMLKLDGGRKMYIFDKMIHPRKHDRIKENLHFFGRPEPLTLVERGGSAQNSGQAVGQFPGDRTASA
jgi:hypothetical protein